MSRIAAVSLGLLAGGLCGIEPSRAQEASPSPVIAERVASPAEVAAAGFRVEVGCSPTQLRTPIATVIWTPKPPRPGREQAEDGFRVDVAASKQGFARGHFVKLIVEGPAPRVEPSAGLAREANNTLGRTLDLKIDTAGREGAPAPGGAARIKVSNLEPGVVYFWRPASAVGRELAVGKPIRVQAPVCVADIVEEQQ